MSEEKDNAEGGEQGVVVPDGLARSDGASAAPDSSRSSEEAAEQLSIPPEVFRQLPPDVRRTLTTVTAVGLSGPMARGPDRLLEKVPPEEAAKCVEAIVAASRHDTDQALATRRVEIGSEDTRHLRNLVMAGVGMVAVTSLIAVCLVMGKDDLVRVLIPLFSGLIAGSLGGYGLGKAAGKGR